LRARPDPGHPRGRRLLHAHEDGELVSAGTNVSGRGHYGGFFAVAGAVAWRQIYKYFTNPAFLAPALFPLFFFVAFAGGLTRVGSVPGFDYAPGYTAFQFVWSLLQAVALGGAFTGFSIAGDFESGFANRLMLAASDRRGILLGYMIASVARATATSALVTVVALLTGMPMSGGVDLIGLIGLAVLVNVAATLFGAGIAMMLRTQQAGPIIRTPIFLVLFLAPVFVPLELLSGWIETVAAANPFTIILTSARGFLAGEPVWVFPAYAVGAGLVVALTLWALFGLRYAERSS
jgi:ABC-2 type transport system permease protein